MAPRPFMVFFNPFTSDSAKFKITNWVKLTKNKQHHCKVVFNTIPMLESFVSPKVSLWESKGLSNECYQYSEHQLHLLSSQVLVLKPFI